MGLKYRVIKYYDSFEDIANDTGSGGGDSSDTLTFVEYVDPLSTTDNGEYMFDGVEQIYVEAENTLYSCIDTGHYPVSSYEELIALSQVSLSPDVLPYVLLDYDLSNILISLTNTVEDASEECIAIFKLGERVPSEDDNERIYRITLMASKEAGNPWDYVDNKKMYRMRSPRDDQDGTQNDNYLNTLFKGVTPTRVDWRGE